MNTIKTLLLTGENNHDWQRTAPFIGELLEKSGKFAVTIAPDASSALEGDLNEYALLFLDYNGPDWSENARANFLEAVRSGTGVVVYHAANNSFENWEEYALIIGLAWREGSGHGEFHSFQVQVAEPEHAITRNLGDFTTEDELYHHLHPVEKAKVTVLAAAYSDSAQGGSGRNEPMLMVGQYGAGRVFHTALGHVWPGDPTGDYRGASLVAIENSGFQTTLLRGCEWAATGDVVEERS